MISRRVITLSALFVLLLGLFVLTNALITKAAEKKLMPFRVPDEKTIPSGPQGELIRRGRMLATHTPLEVPQFATSSLRCNNCHLKAGTVPYAAPWVGVTARFPRFSPRSDMTVSLAQRIQGCFQRSLNGNPPPVDSEPMLALLAYMEWLSQYVPPGATVDGRGIPALDEPLEPDRTRGKKLFLKRCSVCHGEDGAGRLEAEPHRYPYGFPPLWGKDSFNIAAGMARLNKAAAFIKRKMPLTAGGTLTDQEAYDIADFVIHQPRPDFPGKENDWPKGGKPSDARY